MKSLIPWNWGAKHVPVVRDEESQSFHALQKQMNRLLEDFFGGTDLSDSSFFDGELAHFNPKLDLKETEHALVVTVEVPGMTEKDVEVTVSGGILTLRGQKNEEIAEGNINSFYHMERKYGSFHRSIQLPCDIDKDKVEALINHGVIKVTMPKSKEALNNVKKIAVKTV